MSKKRLSFSDSYRAQMVVILDALGKEEARLQSSLESKSNKPLLKENKPLVKSMLSHRKELALLFFNYLLEDED